jgi:protein-S-isoprenylcysteine O-methyltransferase Ste14
MAALGIAISLAWALWAVPFFGLPRAAAAQTLDRRARWGIVVEAIGFAFVWSQWPWAREPAAWRWMAAVPFLIAAPLLSWTSVRTLGRQWRVDAGLNADHRLVQRGAYRFLRHPIYASMFALLLGMGFLVSRPHLLAVAVVFFVAGTEIRVRLEDALLASRFGAEFEEYRRRVPAYIPFVR